MGVAGSRNLSKFSMEGAKCSLPRNVVCPDYSTDLFAKNCVTCDEKLVIETQLRRCWWTVRHDNYQLHDE